MGKSLIVKAFNLVSFFGVEIFTSVSLCFKNALIFFTPYFQINSSFQNPQQYIQALIHTHNDCVSSSSSLCKLSRPIEQHCHRSEYLITLLFPMRTDRMIMMHPNAAKLTHSLSVYVTQLDNP